MLRILLVVGSVLTACLASAQATDGPGAGIDGLGFSAIENAGGPLPNRFATTRILTGMFDDWGPYEEDADSDLEVADSDPPLTHPISDEARRFASDNNQTKTGWTSSLGLLPRPETKVSLPSPDVRLQERGIHFGALYRF